MTEHQERRAAAKDKAREAKRLMKERVQAEVLAEVAAAEKNAHQQLLLAQASSKALTQLGMASVSVGEETGITAVATVPTAPGSTAVQQSPGERGRPSDYTEEEADRICAWVAEGRSLRSYTRLEHRGMDTVYRWLREHRDFRERYARAHEDRADSLADEITDIADEAASGTMEEIQAARLRVDARKWVASKLKPTKWGEYVADTAKTNVVFNIGIRAHNGAPTIDVQAAPILVSRGDK